MAIDFKTTDSRGLARVECPTESSHLIIVRKAGFSPHYRWVEQRQSTHETHVTLRQTDTLTGLVLDARKQQPIENARVSIRALSRGGEKNVQRSLFDRILMGDNARTDRNGSFVFKSLRDEYSELRVEVDGYPTTVIPVVSPPGEHLVVHVDHRGNVRGSVRDLDGEPIADAPVGCASRGQLPALNSTLVRSDQNGFFVIEDAPLGLSFVFAMVEGYELKKHFVTIEPDTVAFAEFELRPQGEFRGTVVDETGAPVDEANIWITSDTAQSNIGQIQTDPDGSWYMHWIPEGHQVTVEASKDGYAMQSLAVVSPQSDLQLVIRRRGSIVGTVHDENGDPVQDFQVHYTPSEASRVWEEMARNAEKWTAFSGTDGHFAVHEAWPDTLEVLISAPGFVPYRTTATVPSGGESEPVQAILSRGEEIWSRLVNSQGAPVLGASIYLPGRNFSGQATRLGTKTRTMSGSDGAFRLAGLPERGFDLAVESPAVGLKLFRDMDAASFPDQLVMDPPGAIRGHIDLPWPRPDTVCEVVLSVPGTEVDTMVLPDKDGRFFFPGVAPGSYVIELMDNWGSGEHSQDGAQAQLVRVLPNQTTEVKFGAQAPGEIRGQIRMTHPRERWFDYEATLYSLQANRDDRLVAQCFFNDAGNISFYGLPVGDYRVNVTSTLRGDMLHLSKPVTLTEGQLEHDLTFLVDSPLLEGVVFDEHESPADVLVSLIDPSNQKLLDQTRVGEEGTYRFYEVQASQCLVWVSGRGYADDYGETLKLPVEEGTPRLEHWMEPEARLHVRVQNDLRHPIPFAPVEVFVKHRPSSLPPLLETSNARGTVGLTRLPSGRTLVSSNVAGHVPATHEITLVTGDTSEVTISLLRFGSLEVLAKDANSATAIPETMVSLTSAFEIDSSIEERAAPTDRQGRVVFDELPPGQYLVRCGDSEIEAAIVPGERLSIPLTVDSAEVAER